MNELLTELVDETAFALFGEAYEGESLQETTKRWTSLPLEARMKWRQAAFKLLRLAGFVREDGTPHTVQAAGEA